MGKSITVVVSHSSYAGSLTATAVTVSKATLLPSISGTMTKIYDGTTEVTAAQGLSITLTGIVTGDEANVNAAVTSYAYDSADVGTNREITATGITLSSGTAAATGDDAEPLLWSTLALLCGLGVVLMIAYRRKMQG